jgi:hypothetical protein
MTFSYTRFPVNKINVQKILEIMRKSLFNYSFYSHPEIWKFQGVTKLQTYWNKTGVEKQRGRKW